MASLTTLFYLPDATLHVEEVQFRDDHCTVQLRTTAPSAACPVCARPSTTVHSRYRRAIRDVPCAGHAVCLGVEVRRFRCHNRACPRRIFAERLPDLAPAFAQRTARLTATLQRLALTLASKSGAPMRKTGGRRSSNVGKTQPVVTRCAQPAPPRLVDLVAAISRSMHLLGV
jgi:transposase